MIVQKLQNDFLQCSIMAAIIINTKLGTFIDFFKIHPKAFLYFLSPLFSIDLTNVSTYKDSGLRNDLASITSITVKSRL